MLEVSAPGRFDESVRHERAGRDDRVHDAAVDQLGNYESLLGDRHRPGKGHHDEAVLIPRHRLEHVGSLAELAAGEGRLRHRTDQAVNGMDLAKVERLQRDQAVFHWIVQFAVDARAFLMIAVRRSSFVLQGRPPE